MDLNASLAHMWAQGDGVSHLITVLLLALSVLSWVVLVVKTWEHWRFMQVTLGLQRASGPGALSPVVASSRYYQDLVATLDVTEADVGPSTPAAERLDQALDQMAHHASWGMVWLGVVGSSAPFVGLLGTVWGIYHALLRMGEQHTARIDQVAGPIGEALIMTALGLAVAIPATVGYNLLVRANKTKQFYAQQLGRRLLAAAPIRA